MSLAGNVDALAARVAAEVSTVRDELATAQGALALSEALGALVVADESEIPPGAAVGSVWFKPVT